MFPIREMVLQLQEDCKQACSLSSERELTSIALRIVGIAFIILKVYEVLVSVAVIMVFKVSLGKVVYLIINVAFAALGRDLFVVGLNVKPKSGIKQYVNRLKIYYYNDATVDFLANTWILQKCMPKVPVVFYE